MTDTLHAVGAGYRDLLGKLDAFNDDHSVGAIWRRADRATRVDQVKARKWKARAINLNPNPVHNAIALSGMTPIMFDERWHLAVALPQPAPCGTMFDEITDVVLIDPASNTAHVMGDPAAPYVAPTYERDRLPVTTDPKAWARSIALDRLEWWNLRRDRKRLLQAQPTWTGDIPSALIIAPLKKVRWSDFHAKIIDVPADMQRDVQRAIYAQANLPRVEGRA